MAPVSRQDVERELEFRRCQKSFPHFFLTHWKVVIPGKVVAAENRPEQLESAQIFQEERRVVVLKARQIGWTTLIAAYGFWKAWFHDAMPVLVLSRREKPEAQEIVAKIRVGYDNLPLWLRKRGPRPMRWNMDRVIFSNGSMIDSDASLNNPARGRTVGLLIMDEFGSFPNPEDAWGSALPATEYGQLIVIGNPNGYGTSFWKLYTDAKGGRNDFRSLFYPWWIVPGRDKDWYDRETASMTPAQRAAEYCEDDESCWNKAGMPVFDLERVRSFTIKPPQITGLLTPFGLRADMDGTLDVWREPNVRHTYVIGADVADGLEYGDYSTASVICGNTGEHVAQFEAHLDVIHFSRFLSELGQFYGWALIGPERNRNGGAVISHLREEMKYPKVYRERTLSGMSARVHFTDKFGWYTSKDSKGVLVNDLWRKLCDGSFVSYSQKFFAQMAAFRYRIGSTGSPEMTGSPHDDVLMSVGIGVQMLKALSLPATQELAEPEKINWDEPQFAFGKTFGEYEAWTEKRQSEKSPRSIRMTSRVVSIASVASGRASSPASDSDAPSKTWSVRRPASVRLNSEAIRTRGEITSGSRKSWLSDS